MPAAGLLDLQSHRSDMAALQKLGELEVMGAQEHDCFDNACKAQQGAPNPGLEARECCSL
jgi:hypothetical protein